MILEELKVGEEVICITLSKDAEFEATPNREVGHIGRVTSIYPLQDAVLVGHVEYVGHGESGYAEFLTPFLVEELAPYEPDEKPLQLAIQKTLVNITREK